ncbi:MAG: copper-binding transcription factor [Piccolia ochrophora]|nr:MAG: copper-binding transcription factor [Piccolia ochrophora]
MAAPRSGHAAEMEGAEKDPSPWGEVVLQGGLSSTGRPAQLARKKHGKVVPFYVGSSGGKAGGSADEDEDSAFRSMARRRKLSPGEAILPQVCGECLREFQRPCDLTKHQKTHSRPWKCLDPDCKYHEYGWPTEKERDRHFNDKHSEAPALYECLYPPCIYKSKRESNCKQHMEKTHGWLYVQDLTPKGASKDEMSAIESSSLDEGVALSDSGTELSSDVESIFSNCSGSSFTSVAAGNSSGAAKDGLFLLLAQDHELSALYKEAFQLMSPEMFEKSFPSLLKTYCADLTKEAKSELERRTVQFLRPRSRRYYIVRRICDTFGPEDSRTADFMLLLSQRREKLLLLERFLNRRQNVNRKAADRVFEHSEEDADSDTEDYFPNVKQVEGFLVGKALTNLQSNTRHFIRSYKGRMDGGQKIASGTAQEVSPDKNDRGSNAAVDQIIDQEDTSLDSAKSQAYEQVVTIHWQCKCGMTFKEDVIEYRRGDANELAKECMMNEQEHDLEKQNTTPESNGTRRSTSGSSQTTACARSASRTQSGPATTEAADGDEYTNSSENSDCGRWVLLCMYAGGDNQVKHACVKTARCNKEMYTQLHQCYNSRFRAWIRWLTLQKIDFVDFVRFHIYWRTNVNIEASDLGKLPPSTAKEYDFDRSAPKPAILRTALLHFIQHPSHAPNGTRHLTRMPKKVGSMLIVGKDTDEEREGWGLHVREVICWRKVAVAMAMISIGALLFAIIWCVLHDGGIQDGFTVTGVLLVYGTVILALLQGMALQRSVKPV